MRSTRFWGGPYSLPHAGSAPCPQLILTPTRATPRATLQPPPLITILSSSRFSSISHLSALLEDVAVAGVVVARGAWLAVHVRDVRWSRVQLQIEWISFRRKKSVIVFFWCIRWYELVSTCLLQYFSSWSGPWLFWQGQRWKECRPI